ncbi:MAG: methyltransferase [Microcoleaceae cyanobacterium]
MGADQFQFKQFTIFQDRCGMKVGTDGVLLGAWTNLKGAQSILDIGTGTGLIALMLAQRSQAEIDAVEIDLEASIQARENVMQYGLRQPRSPWQNRVQVHHTSIQDYSLNCGKLYDLLVTNPPFFTNVSKGADSARNLARHDDQLTVVDLFRAADKLLNPEGRITLIYPDHAMNQLREIIRQFGFFCNQIVEVKPTAQSVPKRVLIEASRQPSCTSKQTLVIETSQHCYTSEFINLVQDFYLKY